MVSPRRIGRYRLIRRIGRGGMGEVHLAQLEATAGIRRLVAIKLLLEGADEPREQAALLAEARLSALLSHPNVVQMIDAGIEDGVPWFAMEFVPGLALAELLRVGKDVIPPWVSARIVADASAGVHAVHQAKDDQGNSLDVVHRDVTPHNLLVSWDGIVKLADFGVARSALQSSSTRAGVVKGKLGYMSPEQAGGTIVDRRSDIFALGILLWEALAHRRLFEGLTDSETVARILRCDVPPLSDVAPAVPASLAAVAMRALSATPAARFSTALDMQRAIDAAFAEAGVLIGASEVAQVIGHLVPERVREHERWLREGAGPGASSTPAGPPHEATLTSVEAQLSTARRRASFPRAWIGVVAAMLGAAVLVTLLRAKRASHEDIATPKDDMRTTAHPDDEQRSRPPPPGVASVVPAPPVPSPPELPAPSALPAAAARKADAHFALKSSPEHATPAATPERAAGVGTLNVSARPTWATVRLDGNVVGSTPIVLSDIGAGPHVLEALPLGNEPAKRRAISVPASATLRVEFVFE
jgi:hypothetical protein